MFNTSEDEGAYSVKLSSKEEEGKIVLRIFFLLLYVLFLPLGLYFIGHFLGTERKLKGQVFNTYCVRVFSTPLF